MKLSVSSVAGLAAVAGSASAIVLPDITLPTSVSFIECPINDIFSAISSDLEAALPTPSIDIPDLLNLVSLTTGTGTATLEVVDLFQAIASGLADVGVDILNIPSLVTNINADVISTCKTVELPLITCDVPSFIKAVSKDIAEYTPTVSIDNLDLFHLFDLSVTTGSATFELTDVLSKLESGITALNSDIADIPELLINVGEDVLDICTL